MRFFSLAISALSLCCWSAILPTNTDCSWNYYRNSSYMPGGSMSFSKDTVQLLVTSSRDSVLGDAVQGRVFNLRWSSRVDERTFFANDSVLVDLSETTPRVILQTKPEIQQAGFVFSAFAYENNYGDQYTLKTPSLDTISWQDRDFVQTRAYDGSTKSFLLGIGFFEEVGISPTVLGAIPYRYTLIQAKCQDSILFEQPEPIISSVQRSKTEYGFKQIYDLKGRITNQGFEVKPSRTVGITIHKQGFKAQSVLIPPSY